MSKNPRLTLPPAETPHEPEETTSAGEETKKSELRPQITRMAELLELRYMFRRNQIRQKIEWNEIGSIEWNDLDETAEADIIYWLKERGYKKPEGDLGTILRSSRVPAFNPILNYTAALAPTGLGQLRRLISAVHLDPNIEINIGGRTYQALFEEYFTKWLMACYFCMTGQKFNDVMLIFIGAQGKHKTSFLNFLCPPALQEYRHTGHIEPTLNNYLTASYLVEKMWINVDDQMENIFGKDYNSMKSIISQDKVSRRMLYSKHTIQQQRLANFCGSVNEAGFLRDSNNRRYLCFAIEDISTDYSEVNMDAVWAEVKELCEAATSKYVFTQEDFRTIDLMDDNFTAPVEENELLKSCFEPATGRAQWHYYLQFSELLQVLKRVSGNQQLKSYNLQTAMRKYGFTQASIRRPERGNKPLHLYTVKIVEKSIYTDQLQQLCIPYRNPSEWSTPGTDESPF